ncbi:MULTISPECIES: hypothetical protein [unclassified Microbacterium]|uniref:hypothetical protein n=1 Tax=unclassified Microbacterium TaxID=2609290 RepID=UPI0021A80BCF|nr:MULTISPECIES: hypothetical protein [unclassified Microbacterium]MCT1364035.1 hypothetical protein [Microbacterium sp. p3-SID131]MCT1375323.1 hypothetical protein [Microbacterium sp. p3-SID337]
MTLVHSDARGRLSLGKIVQADRDYRVTTSPHGTVTLEPVTVISDYEAKVLANKPLVEALDIAAAQVERGEVHTVTRRRRLTPA